MASFTPEQKDIILNRGFQGADGNPPLIPVNSHRIYFDGISFFEYDTTPQRIYNIGDIVEWSSGSIHKSAIFWVSAVTAESDNYYNNSVEIAVTIGDDGNGKGTIRIQFADKDDIPNTSNYETTVTPRLPNGDFLYSGNCYLCLAFVNGELLFTVSYELITALNYTPMRVVTTQGFSPVNPTQWEANQPFLYWLEQNDSDYYDPDEQVPETTEGGGGGGFYRASDTIGFSGLPALDILDFGCVSLYKMNTTNMRALSSFLWSNDFFDNIIKNWQSPFDNIISIGFIPLNSELTGVDTNISIGNVPTDIVATKLSKSVIEKDFGRVNFKELYNNFADYAPFTKLQIYLPSVGVKDLNPDDYMDGALHLMCYVDCLSGTCVYQLKSIRHGREHVVDNYTGNVLTAIPITGRNFIDAYKGVMNGLSSVTSGNIGGLVSSAFDIKPTYQKTGSISGSSTRLSVHTPYIFFDTAQLRQPKHFREQHGYVSHQTKRLGDCTGYNEILYIDIDDLTAIDSEKDEILSLLKSGVYV